MIQSCPFQTIILSSTRINEEGTLKNQLHITFEGPRVGEDGLAVGDLQKTLTHVQRALRLMVGHLMGADPSRQRKPSNLVRDHSALRLVHTSPGSFVTVLELSPPPGTQHDVRNYGPRAVSQLLSWKGGQDPSLPQRVAAELIAVRHELSEDIDLIRLRDPETDRSLTLTRTSKVGDPATPEEIDATLQGRLMMVDWKRRTAKLHRYGQPSVRLRFDAALDDEMQRRATRYVKAQGRARFTADGSLVDFHVRRLEGTRSSLEPFDLGELLNDPNPKIFDPDNVVRASEPFDVDAFMRIVRKGRDA